MPSQIYAPSSDIYRLSDAFRARVEAVSMQAHRVLNVDVIRQNAQDGNVMQTLSWQGFDRLDLGVEDIMLARAILEHPPLAPVLMPYFSDPFELPPVALRVRELFDMASLAPVPGRDEIDDLIADTDRALDDCTTMMSTLPKSALVGGFLSRDIAGRAAMIDRAPALRHYACLKDRVRDWVLNPLKAALLGQDGNVTEQDMGPVHSIRITSRAVTSRDELMEARAIVAAMRGESNRVGLMTPRI